VLILGAGLAVQANALTVTLEIDLGAEIWPIVNPGALDFSWGEGVFGPFSGKILRKRNEH